MKDLIAHILSPHRLVRVEGKTYKVKQNVSWELAEEAQLIESEYLKTHRFEKILRRSQVEPILERLGFAISTIPALQEKIKELKKDLYRKFPDLIAQRPYRSQLLGAKKELTSLYGEINTLDTHTLEFYAERAAIFHRLKHCVVGIKRSQQEDYAFIERLYYRLIRQSVSREEIRHMARNDYWRQYWSVKKTNLFKYQPLTDEQLALCTYSKMYDNIFNHHEAPPQPVIDDDDMLDGWLLIQQVERGKKKQPSYGHKIDSSKEIFVMAQDQEHANAIHDMNEPEQRAVQRMRQRQLSQHGQLSYGKFADVKGNMQNATR